MPARRIAACLAAVAALLAGCSNTEPAVNRNPHTGTATASSVGTVQQVTITTGDDYRFHPSTIVVHPGRVRIVLRHTGTGGPHDWSLTGFPAAFVPLTQAGGTNSATFVAPSPGRYRFVCTIHVRQGQTGTLVVRP